MSPLLGRRGFLKGALAAAGLAVAAPIVGPFCHLEAKPKLVSAPAIVLPQLPTITLPASGFITSVSLSFAKDVGFAVAGLYAAHLVGQLGQEVVAF